MVMLILLVPLITLAWALAWRYGIPSARLPLVVFLGAYLATCGVGSALLGIAGDAGALGGIWPGYDDFLTSSGLDRSSGFVKDPGLYWILWGLPLIIPPLVVTLLCSRRTRRSESSGQEVPWVAYVAAFGTIAAYAAYTLLANGFGSAFTDWATPVDYQQAILQRSDLMQRLSGSFYGVVYVALPVLSQVAFFRAVKERQMRWAVAFAASFIMVCLFSLAVQQKGPVLIYLATLVVGLVAMGKLRARYVPLLILPVVLLFTALQRLTLAFWTPEESVLQLIFRLASSFPFYVNSYPGVLPFSGIDIGLDIIGIGQGPRDNLDVFNLMYGSTTFVQGAVTAPAHLRAYSQGGVSYAIFTVFLAGCAIAILGRLREKTSNSMRHALLMGGVLFLYYLTQTSLREALIASYGFAWTAMSLALLWVLANVFESASRSRFTRESLQLALRRGEGLIDGDVRVPSSVPRLRDS